MIEFLRPLRAQRAMPIALAVAIAGAGTRGLCDQVSGSLGDRLAVAKAKAQEGNASQDAQVRKGKFAEASDLGLALLEDVREAEWQPDQLQGLLKEMAYGWLSNLPREDQTSWVDRHATSVNSASGHLVVGFMEWKIGRRAQALARAAHVLSAAPDSFAASMAMMGILTVHYHRGDFKGGTAALKSFIKTAPNNPMVGWGIRGFAWAACRKDQPQLANALIDEVLATSPDTKAGQAAAQMRRILDAIWRRDYASAFAALEKIETSSWYETVLNDTVLAFVVPAKSGESRKQLIDAMAQLAATYPHPAGRPLAQCIMATAYRVNGQYAEAAQVFEQTFQQTQQATEPLIRAAFEGYLLSQLGQAYAKFDPERAIPYLERFRSGYGKNAGAEFHHITLGKAYLGTGKTQKAYELFTQLEDQRKSGETIANDELKGSIQSGLVASLDKLGRKAEADAVAAPLLSPLGYGQPTSALSGAQRSRLTLMLSMMGRDAEAKQYQDSK
jgi:tetratricopeptide (TPR) repeat protein